MLPKALSSCFNGADYSMNFCMGSDHDNRKVQVDSNSYIKNAILEQEAPGRNNYRKK